MIISKKRGKVTYILSFQTEGLVCQGYPLPELPLYHFRPQAED